MNEMFQFLFFGRLPSTLLAGVLLVTSSFVALVSKTCFLFEWFTCNTKKE